MLFDPRHERTPSLAGFALFVASRDESGKYNWPNCRECAVGQYLASLGLDIPLGDWRGELGVMNRLAHGGANFDEVNDPSRWTFGALADRILAYQRGERTFENALICA